MNRWKSVIQTFLCALAIFVAKNSIGTMCLGRYYQPKEPKELSTFRELQ